MPSRAERKHPIGATQPPDFDPEQLQQVELTQLERGFALEDISVRSASLAEVDAGSGSIARAQLDDVELGDCKLRAIALLDVALSSPDAANGDWGGASLRRVRIEGARLTGLSLAEARLEEVHFKSCKLDYANFRHSEIERVTFEDCVLSGADFQGAQLSLIRFEGCQLAGGDFTKAKLSRVDFRSSQLALAGSLIGLRGAIIDPLQLIELAPTLAHELGIAVEG